MANLAHSQSIADRIGNPAHLAARVANLLEIVETILDTAEPNERHSQAALGLIRATIEDADELADLLNAG